MTWARQARLLTTNHHLPIREPITTRHISATKPPSQHKEQRGRLLDLMSVKNIIHYYIQYLLFYSVQSLNSIIYVKLYNICQCINSDSLTGTAMRSYTALHSRWVMRSIAQQCTVALLIMTYVDYVQLIWLDNSIGLLYRVDGLFAPLNVYIR